MMSDLQIQQYRNMTNSQRLEFTLQRIREEWPLLTQGTPDVVARRFELLRRENDERNHNMRVRLAYARNCDEFSR